MSDLLSKIDATTTRIVELQAVRAELEKSANAHEEQARADRRRMTAIKEELAQLHAVVSHTKIAHGVEQIAAAAQQSAAKVAEHEKALAKDRETLAAKMAELDAILAKAEPKPE